MALLKSLNGSDFEYIQLNLYKEITSINIQLKRISYLCV